MDRRKDMGLPTSAFPLDLPSPGLMPLPDASQQPQHVAGPSGEPLYPAVHPFYPAVHLQHGPCRTAGGHGPWHGMEGMSPCCKATVHSADR